MWEILYTTMTVRQYDTWFRRCTFLCRYWPGKLTFDALLQMMLHVQQKNAASLHFASKAGQGRCILVKHTRLAFWATFRCGLLVKRASWMDFWSHHPPLQPTSLMGWHWIWTWYSSNLLYTGCYTNAYNIAARSSIFFLYNSLKHSNTGSRGVL